MDHGEPIIERGEIVRSTDLAVLFAPGADPDTQVWLPLSQIEIRGEKKDCEIEMPEWLAEEKGLA